MPQIVEHNQRETRSPNEHSILFQQIARVEGGSDRGREDEPKALPRAPGSQPFLELACTVLVRGGNRRGSQAHAAPTTGCLRVLIRATMQHFGSVAPHLNGA